MVAWSDVVYVAAGELRASHHLGHCCPFSGRFFAFLVLLSPVCRSFADISVSVAMAFPVILLSVVIETFLPIYFYYY